MSNAAFSIPSTDYVNPLANVITDYQASEQFEKDKWGDAVRLAFDTSLIRSRTADEWKTYYTEAEAEQVAARMAAGENIHMTKAGKVVASKAFPKTWNTDKSIIGKALEAGVDLFDDMGEPKPKSALQEEYKEAGSTDVEKTAMEKIITTINTYGALYGQLSDEDKEVARTMIAVLHTS